MAFLFYFNITIISYLTLTAGSGEFFYLWSVEEFTLGIIISILVSGAGYRLVPVTVSGHIYNPLRWIVLIFYMTIPFFLSLLVANVEVIYRVITGRINPAVIKLETGYKSPIGTYFLANSITLSPGTLTLEMDERDNSLYIHCLSWKKEEGEPFEPKEVAPFIYYWLKIIYN
jgi:multicomponent Na+:H+ antiporter subunit E